MGALRESLRRFAPAALFALLLVPALFLVSRQNYLLFHVSIEIVAIVVAFGCFMVAWNTRRIGDNGYLLFLGLTFLFVAALDLLHTLAYRGMGVFPRGDANLPTQLWIAARAFESVALLLAPVFLTRAMPVWGTLAASAAVTVALTAAIFSGCCFPDCFVEGRGLTPFKVASEYVIVAVLSGALWLLSRRKAHFEPRVFGALALSLLLKIGAELSFTLYADVYGLTNLLGHLLKFASFVLIYQAIVETGIARPFEVLFRNLKRGEEALQSENRQLAAAREELEAKNAGYARLIAEKNELLGIAAHDIRSPLAAVEMYSSFLTQNCARRGDDESIKFLESIRRTNRRALDMVSTLLDLTAIESGRIRLEPRLLDLPQLVAETLDTHRMLARAKGVGIDLERDGTVPPVPADPLRFEQALANLVSNAVKFSARGGQVTVRLFRRGEFVCVSVQDRGIGIAREDLGKIFQPFSDARRQGTAGERTTGLGLAITQKIATSHGGSVEVQSEPGRGSTFTICFSLQTPCPDKDGTGRGERI